MKTELIFGELSGGGGGTEHTIKVTLNHTGAYGTSITFTVSLDGTQAATKTITATNAGRNYDDNLDFTVDGKTLTKSFSCSSVLIGTVYVLYLAPSL